MASSDFNKVCSDVLIIGGGGAGLTAAIKAREMGADVTVVSKSRVGYGNNTFISKGSIAAALSGSDPRDNPDIYIRDALESGRFINDRGILQRLAEEAEAQVAFLEKCGVRFRKRHGSLLLSHTPGHSFPRNYSPEKQIGSEYAIPLRRYALKAGVKFHESILITRLLSPEGQFGGALGLSREGTLLAFSAKSCVLATGGFAQIYLKTNNSPGATGDGQVLAFETGLPLKDIEFVQFYPTAVGNLGTRMLLYERFVFQAGAILRNSGGENVIAKHGLTGPLVLTRDRLARAVMKEILDGFDVQGGIIMDLKEVSQENLLTLRHQLPADWSPDRREFVVSPTTHFCMGGIITNENGETDVNGLFAAGEVCAGAHGSNRLGGNALAEAFAMGSIAGKNAAFLAKQIDLAKCLEKDFKAEETRLLSMVSRGAQKPKELQRKLKEVMWHKAGVIRDGKGLREALTEIEEIKSLISKVQIMTSKDLLRTIELNNMLTMSEIVCRAALLRTESRGAHYRSDFPMENGENWLKNIVIRKHKSGMQLQTLPIPFPPSTP